MSVELDRYVDTSLHIENHELLRCNGVCAKDQKGHVLIGRITSTSRSVQRNGSSIIVLPRQGKGCNKLASTQQMPRLAVHLIYSHAPGRNRTATAVQFDLGGPLTVQL